VTLSEKKGKKGLDLKRLTGNFQRGTPDEGGLFKEKDGISCKKKKKKSMRRFAVEEVSRLHICKKKRKRPRGKKEEEPVRGCVRRNCLHA